MEKLFLFSAKSMDWMIISLELEIAQARDGNDEYSFSLGVGRIDTG